MRRNVDELFFEAIQKQAYAKKLMSREHYSADGTLLAALGIRVGTTVGADKGYDTAEFFYGCGG